MFSSGCQVYFIFSSYHRDMDKETPITPRNSLIGDIEEMSR